MWCNSSSNPNPGINVNFIFVSSQITSIDCKDALDMICNLESEGDEKGALCLCTAFLKRQLLQEEVYCAWWVSNTCSSSVRASKHGGKGSLPLKAKIINL